MAEQTFDADNVKSLAEAIAERTGALTLAPPAHLPLWLPNLTVPAGWRPATGGATRILVRQLGNGNQWDGCEVLNLYRIPSAVAEPVVFNNADRTLRDSGAQDIQVLKLDTPPRYGVMATRAAGTLNSKTRAVRAQYNNHVVNSTGGAALIEQIVLVGAELYPALAHEVTMLTDAVHRALLASIDSAPNAIDGVDGRHDRRDTRHVVPASTSSSNTVRQGER